MQIRLFLLAQPVIVQFFTFISSKYLSLSSLKAVLYLSCNSERQTLSSATDSVFQGNFWFTSALTSTPALFIEASSQLHFTIYLIHSNRIVTRYFTSSTSVNLTAILVVLSSEGRREPESPKWRRLSANQQFGSFLFLFTFENWFQMFAST